MDLKLMRIDCTDWLFSY